MGSGMRRSTAGCCWSQPGRARAPFLWAFLPPFAIGVVEKIAFKTSHFVGMLQYRLIGARRPSTTAPQGMELMDLACRSSLRRNSWSAPGLWIGLAFAAAFLAAAVRLRRNREPI